MSKNYKKLSLLLALITAFILPNLVADDSPWKRSPKGEKSETSTTITVLNFTNDYKLLLETNVNFISPNGKIRSFCKYVPTLKYHKEAILPSESPKHRCGMCEILGDSRIYYKKLDDDQPIDFYYGTSPSHEIELIGKNQSYHFDEFKIEITAEPVKIHASILDDSSIQDFYYFGPVEKLFTYTAYSYTIAVKDLNEEKIEF